MNNQRGRARSEHAIISGGSSGIGYALAANLARDGISVTILARCADRLNRAAEGIAAQATGAARVHAIVCDVDRQDAVMAAVQEAHDRLGPPTWAITSAGFVVPAKFVDTALDDHRAQFQTNFFGTLHLVHAAVPLMSANGGGRLILIGSGAGISGVYGYSGYGASKFAVRGLAEVLSVELRSHGISVTLAQLPDTDTPQLAHETPLRPAVTGSIAAGAGIWDANIVARNILAGARRKRFLVAPGIGLRALQYLQGWGGVFRTYQRYHVAKCANDTSALGGARAVFVALFSVLFS